MDNYISEGNEERLLSVARKLSTIEEQRQDQSCLFLRGVYRNKGYNAGKLSWVRVPMKIFSVPRVLSLI
jgi:hypothetical protein